MFTTLVNVKVCNNCYKLQLYVGVPNIYFVNVKVDGKYDCREKVPNIYFVNVKVDGKYDCREKVPNIYEVNVKGEG